MVKVFPLPPVGGPDYLRVARGPLSDIPMLASGGFPPEEIPDYHAAGAIAYGIGAPILGSSAEEIADRVGRALERARGSE